MFGIVESYFLLKLGGGVKFRPRTTHRFPDRKLYKMFVPLRQNKENGSIMLSSFSDVSSLRWMGVSATLHKNEQEQKLGLLGPFK